MKTKSIFLVLLTVMCLTSCGWRHNRTPEVKEVHPDYVYKFEHEGHSYIVFKYNGSTNYHNCTGVVHDPDCPCNNH